MVNKNTIPDGDAIKAAKKIWDYMKMNQTLYKSDLIFVLGSRDERVASYAASLHGQGYGKKVLASGGIGHKNDLLSTKWKNETEAERFAKIIIKSKVPVGNIILEN